MTRDYFGGRIPGWLIGRWAMPMLWILTALFLVGLLAVALVGSDAEGDTESRRPARFGLSSRPCAYC